jgi:WD40 repeat protein
MSGHRAGRSNRLPFNPCGIAEPICTSMRTCKIDHGRFQSCAFHPTASVLVSLDSWGSLRLWDLGSFTQRARVVVPAAWNHVLRFAPHGQHMLIGRRVLDCEPLLEHLRRGTRDADGAFAADPVLDTHCLAFSPDSQHVARCLRTAPGTGQLADLEMWDLDGNCLQVFPGPGYVNPSLPNAAAFSPDGCYLAATQVNYSVRVWEVASGEQVTWLEHTEHVHAVAYAPSGRQLATLAEGFLRWWDPATGQRLLTRKGFDHDAFTLAFHPSGRCVAAGSVEGFVRQWNAVGHEVATWDWEIGPIKTVAFSPDGAIAAACGEQTIVLWDVDTEEG